MRGSMEVLLEAVPVPVAVWVFVFVPVVASLSLAELVADPVASVAEAVSESVAVAGASVVEATSPVVADSAAVVSKQSVADFLQNLEQLTISSCKPMCLVPLIASNQPQQHAQHTEKHKEAHIDRLENHDRQCQQCDIRGYRRTNDPTWKDVGVDVDARCNAEIQ